MGRWWLAQGGSFAGAIAAMLLFASSARAQGDFRNFFDTLITDDATPSNEVIIQPGWVKSVSGSNVSFSWSIEKQLSDNFSLQIGDSIGNTSRRPHSSTGLDDVDFFGKYALYTNLYHEFRVAAALDVFAPTGDTDAGAESHTRAGPALLFEKGAGDLPDRGAWHFMRSFAIEAVAEYTWAASGHQSDNAEFDIALSYQFSHLRDSGTHLPGGPWLARFTPFTEFDYQQVTFGRFNSTPPDWRITPGIAWADKYYGIALGTQLALNDAAIANTHAVVLVGISIYYDQFTSWGGDMLF